MEKDRLVNVNSSSQSVKKAEIYDGDLQSITICIKLRSFQYRIVRALVTNVKLQKYGIIDSKNVQTVTKRLKP